MTIGILSLGSQLTDATGQTWVVQAVYPGPVEERIGEELSGLKVLYHLVPVNALVVECASRKQKPS